MATLTEKFLQIMNVNYPQCFRTAYVPKGADLVKETGFEQKYGGSVPYFQFGETWPELDEEPLIFIAQFYDPVGYHEDKLIRVFIKNPDNFMGDGEVNAKILPIKVTQQQQIIKSPVKSPIKHPFQIIRWIKKDDFSSSMLSNATDVSFEIDENIESIPGFKLHGWGDSCQEASFDHYIQNVLYQKWGDAGSLHIDKDGSVWGDMC